MQSNSQRPMRAQSCSFALRSRSSYAGRLNRATDSSSELVRCHHGMVSGAAAVFVDLFDGSKDLLDVRNRIMILTFVIMKTLPEAILAYAHGSPEGHVLSPKEFLHMGNRTAVDQALSRLSRAGLLIRVGRGAYVAPVQGRTSGGPALAEKIVESLAALSGELIAPDGAASAMAFGLAEQGQTESGYVTSGRTRTLLLGEVEVVLQHAPAWMLTLGNGPTGAAVRAMAWLGYDTVDKSLAKIRQSLSSSEWLTLVACRAALPSWMAGAIGEAAARSTDGRRPRPRPRVATKAEPDVLIVKSNTSSEVVSNQTTGTA